jgi:citrate lyase subunit beta/citryl-CoA lyase
VVSSDDPQVLAKALGQGADAVIVDLTAAEPDPATARAAAAAFASTAATPARSGEIWLRVSPGSTGHDDAREVISAATTVHGIVVARTESPVQLDAVDSVLSIVETDAGLPSRSLAVVPSIESAGALLAAPALARAPRVTQLYLAEEEIIAEAGIEPDEHEEELAWLRSQVVFASVAAGLAAPIASAPSTVDNLAMNSTRRLRRLGFGGRACTRPDQVVLVEEVFRPSQAEIEQARDLVGRWVGAARDRGSMSRDAAGLAIDEARVRRAQRLLSRL